MAVILVATMMTGALVGRPLPTTGALGIASHDAIRWNARAHLVLSSSRAEAQAALFHNLLQSAEGKAPRVRLQGDQTESGRGLFTAVAIASGQEIIRVPPDICLTAHRSGVVNGLVGQTEAMDEAAGDLRLEVGEEAFRRGATWDIRLALGVFEATAGCGGPFWDQYRRLLPLPPLCTSAASVPIALLAELQDPVLQSRAGAKAALLRELYPSLSDHAVHPVTASYVQMDAPLELVPLPLQWAYSLVVSRCFTMADGDTFACVPFLDMCQHADLPAANFSSLPDGGFVLTALRPLKSGDEVTISYDGGAYDSRRMFELYGFAPSDGTARDGQLLSATVAAAARSASSSSDSSGAAAAIAAFEAEPSELDASSVKTLLRAFDAHRGSPWASPARLAALFDALTETAAPAPEAFYHGVRWQRQEWSTSIEEDLQELLEAEQQGSERDTRVEAVLSYRLARKKQLALAEDILHEYLMFQGVEI